MAMATDKKQTSLRLSTEARTLQEALARKLGLSLTAIIEMAVRQLAERYNVKAKPTK
jgi:hypothetical protein